MPKIVRLTLLKLTDPETIQQAIQKYSTLTQDAKKVRTCFFFLPHSSYLIPCIPVRRCMKISLGRERYMHVMQFNHGPELAKDAHES
jgi:hypothetical protein